MRRLLSQGIFVGALVALTFAFGPTVAGGPASYVIVDGQSMEPTYHHDDLVIAYERDAYEVSDVIVYDANVAGQFNVVHRIIERTDDGFVTQGDNVPEPDFWIAEDEHIYGSVVLHIPRGGVVVQWLRQPFVIFSLMMGWAAFEFMKAREKEKREKQERDEHRELETIS